MRPFVRVLLCLLLACAATHGLAQADPAQTSVWIDVTRDRGVRFNGYVLPRAAEGMGVVITSTREIATAAHVVWQARSITIVDAKGAKAQAEIACIDPKVDIALLRVERPFRQVAALRARPAVAGEPVVVVERPEPDEEPSLSSGLIGALSWTSNGVPVPLIFSGIKGEKGMSGGGLFDAKGDLLGIVIRIDGVVGYLSALPIAELCTRFGRCAKGARTTTQAQACGTPESPAAPASSPLQRIADRQ